MEKKILEFDGTIRKNGNMDAAYVEVPCDIREVYGKGRLLVHAEFDDVPYSGQVCRMKTPGYIIGITKAIRRQLGKSFGDTVHVRIEERDRKKT